jgi:hypothetical protein
LHHLIHAAYPSYWKKNFGYYSWGTIVTVVNACCWMQW